MTPLIEKWLVPSRTPNVSIRGPQSKGVALLQGEFPWPWTPNGKATVNPQIHPQVPQIHPSSDLKYFSYSAYNMQRCSNMRHRCGADTKGKRQPIHRVRPLIISTLIPGGSPLPVKPAQCIDSFFPWWQCRSTAKVDQYFPPFLSWSKSVSRIHFTTLPCLKIKDQGYWDHKNGSRCLALNNHNKSVFFNFFWEIGQSPNLDYNNRVFL